MKNTQAKIVCVCTRMRVKNWFDMHVNQYHYQQQIKSLICEFVHTWHLFVYVCSTLFNIYKLVVTHLKGVSTRYRTSNSVAEMLWHFHT